MDNKHEKFLLDKQKLSIRNSFSVLLAHEAKKLLSPKDTSYFTGEPVFSIAILHRFLRSRIFPAPYTIIETGYFKKSLGNLSDKVIFDKIAEFKQLLRCGDQRLNCDTLTKRDRFVSTNNSGFFDKNGIFVSDFLSDIIGIRHFHIGYNKDTNDNLLFVRFDKDVAFLLTVGTHKDIHVDSGNSAVFRAIEVEFPSELDKFFPELKGVFLDNLQINESQKLDKAKILKSAGVNSFFVDSAGRSRMFGLGFSSARTPISTTLFIQKVRQELHWIFFENNEFKLLKNPPYVVSFERIDSIPHVISCQRDNDLKLHFTFTKLNELSNITKLIDIIDDVYFAKGENRKLMAERIKKRCLGCNAVGTTEPYKPNSLASMKN